MAIGEVATIRSRGTRPNRLVRTTSSLWRLCEGGGTLARSEDGRSGAMSLTEGELGVANSAAAVRSGAAVIEGRSLLAIAWGRLRTDRLAMAGGVVVILLGLVAIFANVLTKMYGQSYLDQHNSGSSQLLDPLTSMPVGSFGGISGTHWLGVTPVVGQDVLSLLLFGARTSLLIAVSATILSLLLGCHSWHGRRLLRRLDRHGNLPVDGCSAVVPGPADVDLTAHRAVDLQLQRFACATS